ncbi:MAG: oligogalacturonate lyase [Luteitalea sp.]|nr:oligogalacturonate lyase [Luteitalea sp.]
MHQRIFVILLLALPSVLLQASDEPPTSWIDPDTGHRVVRLTSEPGSASLYFNQNGYTADGSRLVYTTPDGISVLDLTTREARQVVKGRARMVDAGRKTPRIYYTRDEAVYSTNVDTGETRKIATLPPRGSIDTVNADETLLAGTYIEGDGKDYNNRRPTPSRRGRQAAAQQGHSLDQPRNKGQMMEERWAARLPMGLFTVDIETGEVKTIHRSNDWLNHLLFSPTDPTLLMFCHEGPWHKVDRIWTIRTDDTDVTKIHTRTMAMEIFGHEFWGADGKTIWYDLQTPRGEDFWLASYNVDTKLEELSPLVKHEFLDGQVWAMAGGSPDHAAIAGNVLRAALLQSLSCSLPLDDVYRNPPASR